VVEVADVEKTVLASGYIQLCKSVSAGAQASGRIIAMHMALDDQVKKGSTRRRNRLIDAEECLLNAEAVLVQASRAAAFK
jgi:macrolide-specific efflux system membrane fusion protein